MGGGGEGGQTTVALPSRRTTPHHRRAARARPQFQLPARARHTTARPGAPVSLRARGKESFHSCASFGPRNGRNKTHNAPASPARTLAPPRRPPPAMDEDSVDIVFHGSAYNLAVTVHEDAQPEATLAVDLEDLSSGGCLSWHGEFSASYLENITSKTGSFKRFPVLVKMLMGALRQQTEHVFLDLLTYADLVSAGGLGGGKGRHRKWSDLHPPRPPLCRTLTTAPFPTPLKFFTHRTAGGASVEEGRGRQGGRRPCPSPAGQVGRDRGPQQQEVPNPHLRCGV
jgi:hypothetical protein